MSFSQKHTGKILVPWFNSLEWRSVYTMLCSEKEENYLKVLRILEVWKIRTPLLSAGVEGTLILLDALFSEKGNLTDLQMTNIFALSLMRFLNVCAANNNKQGTFSRTVVKNDLPKWLIDIRHDIAHGQKLPSKSMLELGLKESLKWLMVKYWDVQNETMSDCVVEKDVPNNKINETLNIYVRLNMKLFLQDSVDEEDEAFLEKINYLISKKYNKSRTDVTGMLKIVEEILKQSFSLQENKNIGEKVAKILVNEKALLMTTLESRRVLGTEIIPTSFRDIWSNLLNITFENGFAFAILNEFLEVTKNSAVDNHIRKVASIWISEIFHGLSKLQKITEELDSITKQSAFELDARTSNAVLKSILEKNPEYKDCLNFNSKLCLSSNEAKRLEEKFLSCPNVYTLNFLERVLKFNKCTDEYINDSINLVSNSIWTNNSTSMEGVMTIYDLDQSINAMNIDSDVEEETAPIKKVAIQEADLNPTKTRWTRIKDTSSFKGCPFGVLPHQKRTENPSLRFCK